MSSNYKVIKNGRSLDLAYQLGAMTIKGLTPPFLLVSSTRQFLTPPAPSYIRGGEKGEYSYIRGGVMGIIAMTIKGLPHLNPLLARRGFIWILCCLFSFNAQATCTPTPDCASIGYTETSCETKAIKCPFDTSKLFCVPCDSSFQYSCTGDNITGGIGSTCGGKYASCECVAGASFSSGDCVCSTSCIVGAIYYSDGSCSSCLDNSKTPVGVVVKDNELIMSNNLGDIKWGIYGTDISSITNYTTNTEAKTDFKGKTNTLSIVSALTTEDATTSAAIACHEYAPTGLESSKGQWYLPAVGEISSYIYANYNVLQNTWINVLAWNTYFSYYAWSSSEESSANAWRVAFAVDDVLKNYKNYTYIVSCFLEI